MQTTLQFSMKKGIDIVDITSDVDEIVSESGIQEGICHIFCLGSTGAVMVNENERRLLDDFKKNMEKTIPSEGNLHPQNSHSHLRAMLIGPSKCIPITEGELNLGNWQSIFLINFDIVSREREVLITIK